MLRDLAGEIDTLLERQLPDAKLVREMQAARQLIARTYNVQDALVGDAVDARKLGQQLKRRPLSGGLREAGQFAQQNSRLARPNVDTSSGAPHVRRSRAATPRCHGAGTEQRQGDQQAAKHSSRLMALARSGAVTGAKFDMAAESAEFLVNAGLLENPLDVLKPSLAMAFITKGKGKAHPWRGKQTFKRQSEVESRDGVKYTRAPRDNTREAWRKDDYDLPQGQPRGGDARGEGAPHNAGTEHFDDITRATPEGRSAAKSPARREAQLEREAKEMDKKLRKQEREQAAAAADAQRAAEYKQRKALQGQIDAYGVKPPRAPHEE